MRIAKWVCPTKFAYARRWVRGEKLVILDIGCGNNSPTTTKHWFPGCYYAGADIQQYNNTQDDDASTDAFYLLGIDGSGYEQIPEESYDFIIMHHVVEHMNDPLPILATLCRKLKPGGVLWIAFPSLLSLSFPPASGTLNFSDDPTHVRVPEIREIANVLLENEVRVVHAGRSRSFWRELIGALILPFALARKAITGKMSSKGLWYILGFEDHVLGRRVGSNRLS